MTLSSRPTSPLFDYSARDVILLAALGLLAGVLNTGLTQLFTPMHFTSWTLELALLQGVFAWAYLVGFYLVRKPGSLLIVGVIEASVQVLMGSTHGTDALGWGLAQGLAAEVIMALALYRSLNPLLFLVAGAAAALLRSLWTAYIWQGWATPDLVQQYQSALPFIALAGVVVSGLVGFLGGASLARLGILPAPSPQSQ